MTLDQLFVKHNCDKGKLPDGVGHNYGRHYEAILEPLRYSPIRMMEIGVCAGKSTRMWLEYFTHDGFRLIGVDKDPVAQSRDRFQFVLGDQSNATFWSGFIGNNFTFDVVIDDGSHLTNGIVTSFEFIWPFMRPGGYYIIEDLKTSYMPGYSVEGWCSQMSFIKQLLDDINAQTDYKPTPDTTYHYAPGVDGTRGIDWMRFSEELCILKKK